ncbi:MAG: flagellar export chaperone FliS [Treponema sp.]|nr:flagellar export chaperone FliS [Treponema sp.]
MSVLNLKEGKIVDYSNAVSSYKETKVKTASQGQLVLMLYDAAIKNLDRSLELLGTNLGEKINPGNIENISKFILKTQEIITELTVSLDFENGGEIAKNLFSLYIWFNRELLEANISHDTHRITAIRNQLNELRSAWAEIAAKTGVESKTVSGVNIAG